MDSTFPYLTGVEDLAAHPSPQHRVGKDAAALKESIVDHLKYTLAELPGHVDSKWEPYVALASAVRDRMIERWIRTQDRYYEEDAKRVYYLSLEYLIGRTLGNSLVNLDLAAECATGARRSSATGSRTCARPSGTPASATAASGGSPPASSTRSPRSAIPRTATACATTTASSTSGSSTARRWRWPDSWLRYGNPWEIARPGDRFRVQFYGRVEESRTMRGRARAASGSTPTTCSPRPYDTPIPGYGTETVNTLRLWGARAVREFDLDEFNSGDYIGAIEARARSENICRVLYPNDNFTRRARRCGSSQEYFFVSATLQDIVRRYKKRYELFDRAARARRRSTASPRRSPIQLNDTHPALAIPELMRILVDEEGLDVGRGLGRSPRGTFGYTNHTVMPEALERWPVSLARRACCPGISRSSTRSTSASSPTVAGTARRRRRPLPADVADRGGRRAARPDGASRDRRKPLRQRRRGAPHRDPEDRRLPRLPRALAREAQQQDERRHPASVAAQEQSRPVGSHLERDRRRLARRPRRAWPSWRHSPTTRRFGAAWRAVKRKQKESLVGDHPRPVRAPRRDARRRSRRRCSTCR